MPNTDINNLVSRVRAYGEYGQFVCELFYNNPKKYPTWDAAQAGAASGFNFEAPPGYDDIKLRICYTSVFKTAWQANFISAARLRALEAESFRRSPFTQLSAEGFQHLPEHMVREHFTPRQAGLYWFFGRSEANFNLNRTTSHLMYTLDGIEAAGSNNYAKAGYPFQHFGMLNLNECDFIWDAANGWWTQKDEPLRLDIVWTPLSVLHSLEV